MIDFLRNLRRPKYEPLNRVEVIAKNLIYNYNFLHKLQPGAEMWPVLKSNAYGHGIREVSKILDKTDCKKIVVDSYPEAQIVYKYFSGKVLMLGEVAVGAYKYCDFSQTEFVVYNIETLKHLIKKSIEHNKKSKLKVHFFINTGMNREGMQEGEIEKLIRVVNANKDVAEIIGVCSHFASADDISELNEKQQNDFIKVLLQLKESGIVPKWRHLGNSAGIFIINNEKYRKYNQLLGIGENEALWNAFRPGIAFYGYNPFPRYHWAYDEARGLKPALRVQAKVVAVQKVKKGDKVSYNETFEADRDGNIAVVSFGYFEGLDRRLSNKGRVMVTNNVGKFEGRIAGRVCMNLTCIHCGTNNVQVGNEVEIISANAGANNSVQAMAELENTICYELLAKLERTIIRREVV